VPIASRIRSAMSSPVRRFKLVNADYGAGMTFSGGAY